MTPRVWIERPIESVEDAEALPEGTVAISEQFAPEVFVKDGDSWLGTHGPGAFTNTSAVGFMALVPVDATVDRAEMWRTVSDLFAAMQQVLSQPHCRVTP